MVSQDLIADFIKTYHSTAVYELASLIRQGKVSNACAGEILRQLGDNKNSNLSSYILLFIADFLSNPSPKIRDGAIMGLSNLGRSEAIPFLLEAISTEDDNFLKYVIMKTVSSLRNQNPVESEDILANLRRPQDIVNLAIERDDLGLSIALSRSSKTAEDLQIPIIFAEGALTNAEFATIQAAGEQIARITLNQLGHPLAIKVSSAIDVKKDKFDRPIGFEITLTGVLIVSKDPKYNPEDPLQKDEEQDLKLINPSEDEIY